MRWEQLFADLEAQLDAEVATEIDAELADRTRGELAKTAFEDRLRGSVGSAVALEVMTAGTLRGLLRRVGSGWLVLDEPNGVGTVIVASAVTGAKDLSLVTRSSAADGVASGQLGIGHVLRVLARDRTPIIVALRDGVRLTGTVDRVGADYFDLAEHPLDEPRHRDVVIASRSVPVAAVVLLRPRAD